MRYDIAIDKWYKIVFLSQHPMGPQSDEKTVAKVVKCAKNTVQYWLNRWKESKDLSDMKRSGRHLAITKNSGSTNLKAYRQRPYCYNRR